MYGGEEGWGSRRQDGAQDLTIHSFLSSLHAPGFLCCQPSWWQKWLELAKRGLSWVSFSFLSEREVLGGEEPGQWSGQLNWSS